MDVEAMGTLGIKLTGWGGLLSFIFGVGVFSSEPDEYRSIGIVLFIIAIIATISGIALIIKANHEGKKQEQNYRNEIKRRRETNQLFSISFSMGHDSVDGWVSGRPNSANGVSVKYDIKNWSEKTIKYYTVYFIPYNAVGDPESCSIRHESERGVRGVGPIPPLGSATNHLFENAWYNPLIRLVRPTKAEIEYMDGSTITYRF